MRIVNRVKMLCYGRCSAKIKHPTNTFHLYLFFILMALSQSRQSTIPDVSTITKSLIGGRFIECLKQFSITMLGNVSWTLHLPKTCYNLLIKWSQVIEEDNLQAERMNQEARAMRQASERGMQALQYLFPCLKDQVIREETGKQKKYENDILLFNLCSRVGVINRILNANMLRMVSPDCGNVNIQSNCVFFYA